MSDTKPSLRERKKDQTRAELLRAALALIERQGFEQATVADIAEAANVSPRTLLRYFPTKEDIIVSWVQEAMALLATDLVAGGQIQDPAQALLSSTRTILKRYAEQAGFFLTLERVIAANPSIGARKEQMIAGIVCDLTNILIDPIYGNPLPRLLADALAGTVIALKRAAIREWLALDGDVSLPGYFDEAATILSFGQKVTSNAK